MWGGGAPAGCAGKGVVLAPQFGAKGGCPMGGNPMGGNPMGGNPMMGGGPIGGSPMAGGAPQFGGGPMAGAGKGAPSWDEAVAHHVGAPQSVDEGAFLASSKGAPSWDPSSGKGAPAFDPSGGMGGGKGGGKDDWGKGGGKDDWGKGGKDDGKGKGKDDGKGKGNWGGKDPWAMMESMMSMWGGSGGSDWGGKGGGKDDWGGKGGGSSSDWLPEQQGWVKNWNEERGFGFVTTASGQDIYTHRTTLIGGQTLVAGAEVWIEAQFNHEKSKWTSTKCSGAVGKGDGKGGDGKGDGKGGKGKGKGKGKRGPDWMEGEIAWVKTWNEERGFGFVSTAQKEDIYAHRTTLTDGTCLTPETEVYVDAKWNWEKNKWHATRVRGAAGDAPKVAGIDQPVTTGVQGGTVKVWHDKGFGFIIPDNGGPDVFVHSKALTEGAQGLVAGHAVVFDLQYEDARGKWLAVSCQTSGVPSATAGALGLEGGAGLGPAAPAGKGGVRLEPYPTDGGLAGGLA